MATDSLIRTDGEADYVAKSAAEDVLLYAQFCDSEYTYSPLVAGIAWQLDRLGKDIRRLVISVPPRHGKSRLVSVEWTSWMMGRRPGVEIVLASYSGDLAKEHSRRARERVRTRQWRTVFPDVTEDAEQAAAANWKLSNGSSYQAVGVGGSLTGRGADILIIDDIHFLKKADHSQEEFFHTFNALHQASKQIVICSDRPPKEIPELEERLRSRFEWGMVVDIQPPDLETRIAILQSKAISKNFELPLEVAEAIAERNASNIRELEGGFNKILMHCELHGGEATVELVEEVLGGVQGQSYGRRKPSPRLILTEIAQYFGVTVNDITGKRRTRDIVLPRQVAMYLLRDELGLSFPQIGSHLGGRDHTTIMHGFGKIELLVSQRAPIVQDISGVKQRIGQEASLV